MRFFPGTIHIHFVLLALLSAGCSGSLQSRQQAAEGSAGLDIQGHRGARGLLPENSIPGFMRALELGATTLEMDVVVSADSIVVVSHEPWMSAEICMTPAGEPVSHDDERTFNLFGLSYEEIRRFDCGSRGHRSFPMQEPVAVYKPRLDSVLIRTREHPAEYNIEIKSRPAFDGTFTPDPAAFASLVLRVVEDAGVRERVVIQSFDPRSLRAVRSLANDVRIALLVDNDDGFVANVGRLGFQPEIYSPHRRLVDAELLREAHAAGVDVIPWTVNDVAEMRQLIELGVDGIITDYPDRLIGVAGE